MRVLVWEYVTAGGWRECGASPSLIAEGAMMAEALSRDLTRVPGVEVVLARDPDIAPRLRSAAATFAPCDSWRDWRRLMESCDAVWPIAPETGGILEEAVALAEHEGRTVLNSRGRALVVARSKRETARVLAARGIPVVATFGLPERPSDAASGWVVKPDDGAGAADTHLVRDRAALEHWRDREDSARFAVQAFVSGASLSLSLLAQEGACWLLSCNRQHVVCEGGAFAYRGGQVGGAEARRAALLPLAERVTAALPTLWGYVGVDLIDGPSGPVVLEVNPRLTTSYAGLAESLGVNPAGLVLALLDKPLAELRHPLSPRPVDIVMRDA